MQMIKCKNADKYQAIYPPRCNNGDPCEACKQKWESINRAKARKLERIRKEPMSDIGRQYTSKHSKWEEENREAGLK